MDDRRGFLAKLIAGGFGLCAGQAVKVEAVEAKVEPATELPRVLPLDGVTIEHVTGRPTVWRKQMAWMHYVNFIQWRDDGGAFQRALLDNLLTFTRVDHDLARAGGLVV